MADHIRHHVISILRAHQPLAPRGVRNYLDSIYRIQIAHGAMQALLGRMRREGLVGRVKGAKYCTLKYMDQHPEATVKVNGNVRAAEEMPWEDMVWEIKGLIKRMGKVEDALFNTINHRERTCTQIMAHEKQASRDIALLQGASDRWANSSPSNPINEDDPFS